ncbi:MAG: ATP/GTP-binding protein, partial [Verrucomicrobiae bacterium]|nr:ATP/GTP-binding protein [Verrucomicrobiae bacterium]
MSHRKIIFAGPVGAGKTTAICTVSEVEPILTDVAASDDTRKRKETTTVAMDYGRISLEGGERVHLYGTPGQERFDFMWEILIKGGGGLILMLDNARPDPLTDLRAYAESFSTFIKEQRLVIGVTRMDLKGDPTLDDYREFLDMA